MTSRTEWTTPSHSQLLANLVANFHSQGISSARTKVSQFHSHSLANSFAMLNLWLFFENWWLIFASESSGRVRIRIRIRSCITATAVHSGLETYGISRTIFRKGFPSKGRGKLPGAMYGCRLTVWQVGIKHMKLTPIVSFQPKGATTRDR